MKIIRGIGKIIFVLVITFILLECVLRLIGTVYTLKKARLYQDAEKGTPHSIKILAVGESTTGGLWIENRSYPIQLQEKMNAYYKCQSCIKVDEFDLSGGNTSSTLANLPNAMIEHQPDIVIIMAGFNDAYFYAYNVDLQILEKNFKKNPLLYRIYLHLAPIIDEIRILRVAKLIYTSFVFPQDRYLDLVETIYRHGKVTQARLEFGDVHRDFIARNTEQNLKKMIDVVKVNGALPILMTYHTGWVNEKIRDAAKQTGTLLIDNEPVFRKLPNYSDYIFETDHWHPNEKGYALIVQNILNFFIKEKLIKLK